MYNFIYICTLSKELRHGHYVIHGDGVSDGKSGVRHCRQYQIAHVPGCHAILATHLDILRHQKVRYALFVEYGRCYVTLDVRYIGIPWHVARTPC